MLTWGLRALALAWEVVKFWLQPSPSPGPTETLIQGLVAERDALAKIPATESQVEQALGRGDA